MATKKEKLACSPSTSEGDLWEVAQSDDELAFLAAANPNAGPILLDRLYSHLAKEQWNVTSAAEAVLTNGRAESELVVRIVTDLPDVLKDSWSGGDGNYPEETDLQVLLAKHRATPAAAIGKLAASPLYMVRERVAMRSDLSAELFQLLSKDVVSHVRRIVAANIATPPPVLEALSRDDDQIVRFRVAMNKAVPEAAVARLVMDTFDVVRLAAMSHPSAQTPA